MDRIKLLLGMGLKELNATDVLVAGRIFALWPEAVGAAIAERAHPRFLRQGVLFVEVSSSAWANELNLLKPKLLQKLEAKLGKGVVRDLRYQVAPTWQERSSTNAAVPAPEASPPPLPELAAEESEAIAADVARSVSDPKLARSVEGLLETVARRRAAKLQAGYRPCAECGALVSPGEGEARCPVCRLAGDR
ncbi:MAG TPA: DUF721 domain-containing protein [Stenomitos sp.]